MSLDILSGGVSAGFVSDVVSLADRVRAAFPFTVDKHRLYGPEGLRTEHFGLFRSDSGECVGEACRSTYRPHTVEEIARLVDAAAGVFPGESKLKTTWRGGHVVEIEPTKDYRRAIFGTADNVFPRLIIRGSYDGRAFRANLGFWRDACRNMSILRQVEGTSVSIKHTDALGGKLDKLRERFEVLAGAWDGTVQSIKAMDAQAVDFAQFLAAVYPLPAGASRQTRRSHEKRINRIFGRAAREYRQTGRGEIGQDYRVSGWMAFNAVQGYVQHDQARRGRLSDFDRALVALEDSAVERAENLLAVAV